jgi:outer membrane protein assembly factor BamB
MVLHEDLLYFLDTNKAILSCVDAKTGEPRYVKQRLEGLQNVFASPVAAKGRIYVACRSGNTAVVKAGSAFELLATNTLDESFSASPVIAGGELFLRGRKHLYCIARD